MSSIISKTEDKNSVLSLKNDYLELLETFNKDIVQISRVEPESGLMCDIRVHVNAPTFILTDYFDVTPKPKNGLSFSVKVPNGYPMTKPEIQYDKNCRLASVNVFRDGTQCTDQWIPDSSSLKSIVEKTIRDIIHDPNVTRYDSMANSKLFDWQKELERTKKIPTINPELILKKNINVSRHTALPASTLRRTAGVHAAGSRALPRR